MDFAGMADDEVFRTWSAAMEELRRRGLIRTANNPVGDYAEALAARWLGLELERGSTEAYDGRDASGLRYQIKARRLNRERPSRVLGALRNLDRANFDFLVVVLFEDDFSLKGIWRLPIDLVRQHAGFSKHVNAHVLNARDAVLDDPRAERLV